MNEKTIEIMKNTLTKVSKVKLELEILQKNREEIYRISKQLPQMEGYKLLATYDDSIKVMNDAWAKLAKELNKG